VDWNDPGLVTERGIREIIRDQLCGCFFLNPQFIVHSVEPSNHFYRTARKCQAAWFRTMSRTLGSANVRRFRRNSEFMERQLTCTGILIIDGRHISPREWRQREAEMRSA
jgi:hypothetical protein